MPVGSLMKPYSEGKLKIAGITATGPSSYASGGFSVTISELDKVYVATVSASANGYVPLIADINGNTIIIAVYQDSGAAGALEEVADGTDLSGVTFYIIALGA